MGAYRANGSKQVALGEEGQAMNDFQGWFIVISFIILAVVYIGCVAYMISDIPRAIYKLWKL